MIGIARASGVSLLAASLGLLPEAAPTALAQATSTQQSADPAAAKPAIRVAPVILAEPDVETSISINVGPELAIPRQTFLRIRGMPLAAKLSEGHVVTPGIWAVPLAALPNLRLLAPLTSSGRTEKQSSLVSADGSVLAENKSSLVVAPAWLLGSGAPRQDSARTVPAVRTELAPSVPAVQTPTPAVVAAKPDGAAQPEPQRTVAPPPLPAARPEAPVVAALPPPASPPPAAPAAAVPPAAPPAPAAKADPPPAAKAQAVLSPADRERAENMLQRGDAFWRQGNLAAARQFFRRAADMGLPAGALRMGATYDPAELSGQGMVGVQPDPKEAALWYERARELGAPEAAPRLSRLQAR